MWELTDKGIIELAKATLDNQRYKKVSLHFWNAG